MELLPDQMDVRDFICRRRSVDLIFRDAICGDAHRNGQSVGAGFCYFHFNRAFCRIVGNVILLSQRTAVRFLQHILVSTRLCKLHLAKIDGSACAVGNGLSALERIVGRIAGVRHQSKLKFTAGQGVSAGQDLACVEFQADRQRCVHLRCHAVRHAGGIIVNDILVRRNCIGIPLVLHGALADQVIIDVALESGQARHPPTFWDLALQICDGKFRLLQRCVPILCARQEFILHLRNRLSAFLAVSEEQVSCLRCGRAAHRHLIIVSILPMGGQCGFVGIDGQLIAFCTLIGIRNSGVIYRNFHRNRGRIQLVPGRGLDFNDFIISFGHRGNRESPGFIRLKHLCLCDVICKRSRGILRANSTQIFFAFFDHILCAGKV